MRPYKSSYGVDNFPYDKALRIWRKKFQRRGNVGISNPSGSGGQSITNNGTRSGSYLDIGSNDNKFKFCIHTNNESKENIVENQMLYELVGKDSDDSNAELVEPE